MPYHFTHRSRVEYADTDQAGVVHFSTFFLYMEEAEHALFRSLGFSVNRPIEGEELAWPRVSCSFDFKAPLRFEDEFEVKLTIEKLGKRSIGFCGEIFCNDVHIATGHSVSVCCHIAEDGSMSGTPLPAALRERLGEA